MRIMVALFFILSIVPQAQAQMMYTSCYGARHIYDAANNKWHVGTRARVTYERTGKSAVVTIAGTGPFKPGRSLDISCDLAKELGFFRRGLAWLSVERLN